MARRILAFGGGGWMAGDARSPLDTHLLDLTGAPCPRICLVATASGDDDGVHAAFKAAFDDRATTSVLDLFQRDVADVGAFLLDQDVVYVGGGSTANLLAVWRLHGVDHAMRAAYDAGVLLTGVSAGMNCWFEASMTDSFMAGTSRPLRDGLGLLAGSCSPHYDGEASRRPAYRAAVADGFPPGIAADDGVGVLFEDGKVTDVVADHEGGHAYRVFLVGGAVIEEPLRARVVGPR